MSGVKRISAWLIAVLVLLPVPAVLAQDGFGRGGREARTVEDATVFDEVWRTVQENFYDSALAGIDWPGLRATYRPRWLAASDATERQRLINEMLGALKASHTEYFIADEPAYYELADLFFPQRRLRYVGIGAYTTEIDGRLFVSGMLDGLPADRAGLKIGDEIIAADGAPYHPIASFAGKQNEPVMLSIRRHQDGPVEPLAVTPVEIRPGQSLLDAIAASARVIDVGGKKIGYVHMWCYFGDSFQRALERQLATTLSGADALIWDLRDGWGGTADGDLDIFNRREATLEAIGRGGRSIFSNVKWTKPAAILINHGTRSAKEIVAYGFKKYGIGPVVGSDTAKAVLGSRAFMMQDGSLLLLAVSDIKIDGERLEGVGVSPTIPVESPLPYRDGADPQLDRALKLLS